MPSVNQHAAWSPSAAWLRAAAFCICILAFLAYVVISWHWSLAGDSQVMHYVVFLMHHGFAPYTQIGDLNMPGAYLVEGWALDIFGRSDLGWRLWDFTIDLLMAWGMVSIARPYDWLAGIFAACIFAISHAADGPNNVAQRDQVIAALLILACAFMFHAVRRQRAWPMVLFAIASGLAASIKPTVSLACIVLLCMACLRLRRLRVSLLPYLAWSLLGFALVAAGIFLFLNRYHATYAFFFSLLHVLPHYAAASVIPWSHMLKWSTPKLVAILAAVALCLAVEGRNQNWEQVTLLLLALSGFLSFMAQHKGYAQHRYLFVAALSLWLSIELALAFRGSALHRWTAGLALVFCCFVLFPRYLLLARSLTQPDTFSIYLDRDLRQMGIQNLQNRVQCMSIVDGCMTVLFHEQIVQTTGATGDLGLFLPSNDPETQRERAVFWSWIHKDPPDMYIYSNEQFAPTWRNFNKAETWPLFDNNLKQNYVMVLQRAFPKDHPLTSTTQPGEFDAAYRLYIRKGSPLLGPAAALHP